MPDFVGPVVRHNVATKKNSVDSPHAACSASGRNTQAGREGEVDAIQTTPGLPRGRHIHPALSKGEDFAGSNDHKGSKEGMKE